MKNAFSYVASIFVSVLLVFCILGVAGAGVAKLCANSNQLRNIAEKHDIDEKVYSELERYFHERSSATGIPENVYMDAIDTNYLDDIIDQIIVNGFQQLRGGNATVEMKNEELEASIDSFFNDYADSIGYKKDDKFEQKLDATKNSAYNTIREYCDVYKFGALESHGVLAKASKVYTHLDFILVGGAALMLVLIVTLLIFNLNAPSESVYWSGVSMLIAGIIAAAPCVYLLATDYFSSFSIKQPQIYTAYTETMKLGTNAFMYTGIVLACVGLLLIIVYAITRPKNAQKKA